MLFDFCTIHLLRRGIKDRLPIEQTAKSGGGAKEVAEKPLRTAVRFPMKLSLRLQTATGVVEAITENISANGILFTGTDLPLVDSRIEFEIRMPAAIMGTPEDVSVHCIGRVVRHQKHGEESQAAAIIDEYYMRA